jgi:mono/diheme cytochrome c family protein
MIVRFTPRSALAILALSTGCALTAQNYGPLPLDLQARLPAPVERAVDFARDIQPIFEESCVQCHAHGKSKGVFSLETRDDFLYGGDNGTPAEMGRAQESLVVAMISGLDEEIVMPKKGKKLTAEQVAVFMAWIDQGLVWPEEITFFEIERANLHPVEMEDLGVPTDWTNPVDGFVARHWAENEVSAGQVVDDRTYARRVWLDTVGLLPPPDELASFLADDSKGKRGRLVQRLLADRQGYAEHWLTFWNDLLRNDYQGVGYIDGGRKQITDWLYSALARNLPYDEFVAELVNPGAEAEGFANGISWRGAVNASMLPPMQAAQGVAHVFLGVNLKCASCHDSFIDDYTLEDSYGMASVYATGPLEIAECDKPTGQMSRVKFLYEEIGEIDLSTDAVDRRRQLADIITGRKNGRLPRTIVNRLWQRFLGRGLVEPVDEMDRAAWSPELMNWLAEDLVANDFDLKHAMARILTSRAYQSRANASLAEEGTYVFRGPVVRRLNAEQFSDAIHTVADLPYDANHAKVNRNAALRDGLGTELPLPPKWIWRTAEADKQAKPENVTFARTLILATPPTEAMLTIAADNGYTVSINGVRVASSSKRTSTGTAVYDIRSKLQVGANHLSVVGNNFLADGTPIRRRPGQSELPETPLESYNPAGLILYARIRTADAVLDLVSDGSWVTQVEEEAPRLAVELGGVELAPWRLGTHFLERAAAPRDSDPVERASLVAANPLMLAMGRPNREQTVTVRQEAPTTLQALELTNGETLAVLLSAAAEQLLTDTSLSGERLVERLYRHTLSRPPAAAEKSLAMELVGSPVSSAGVQDLLWVLTALPEFQLIY